MKKILNYGFFIVVIGVVVAGYFGDDTSLDYTEDTVDLNAVLDVTIDTIYAFDEKTQGLATDPDNPDAAFLAFTDELQVNLNNAEPKVYDGIIALSPQTDASIYAFEDKNANGEKEEEELGLFLVEIDGENSRVIASSRSGAVKDHRFSGTGLLAGYLIGSMLSRQKASGVNTKSLANKKTQTAKQAARARAGSGSHSRGK